MGVEEMEAGPELNALVAEVMGWRQFDFQGLESTIGTKPDTWYDPDHLGRCWKGSPFRIGDRYDHLFVPWAPSTNIAAAWQVVEKLYSEGWTINVGSLAAHPRGWRCTLTQMHADDFYKHPQTWEANADTVCLAICRAALLAVGVEEV
jgi:hypothetical protein